MYTLAMDIGGSHAVAALVDAGTGEILERGRSRVVVDAGGSREEVLGAWCRAAGRALETAPGPLIGYGVAMPGPFDYERGICLIRGLAKYDRLYGVDVRREMKSRLGLSASTPVLFRNDAVCFLLGEHWKGAAQGAANAVGITLGTGLGSAFLRDGEITGSGKGIPPTGWFYNTPFRDGLAEDYFSARGLLARYEAAGGKAQDSREMAERTAGDPVAREVFADYGRSLAEFLLPWMGCFGAEVLVIGGNIARSWEWFAPALIGGLSKELPELKILVSQLLEDAALLGAGRLPLRYHEPGAEQQKE